MAGANAKTLSVSTNVDQIASVTDQRPVKYAGTRLEHLARVYN